MNLKESFRYQNFLTELLCGAQTSLTRRDHCLKETQNHLRSKVNPDAADESVTVEVTPFFPNDTVLSFMVQLVTEREKLCKAIHDAKQAMDFDLDGAVEANKSRQRVCSGVRDMLAYKASTTTTQGRDYKFNVNNEQQPYVYTIEVTYEEAFDREEARRTLRELQMESDRVSAAIDAAMINTTVDYHPPYDVNDTFEDAVRSFELSLHERQKKMIE